MQTELVRPSGNGADHHRIQHLIALHGAVVANVRELPFQIYALLNGRTRTIQQVATRLEYDFKLEGVRERSRIIQHVDVHHSHHVICVLWPIHPRESCAFAE